MIIILEGCDLNGKSVLAKKLTKYFKAKYLHFSKPAKPPYQEYSECLDSLKPDKFYVIDRFCYGEMVYGKLLRGKSGLSENQLTYLELRLKSHGTEVIHCQTSLEENKINFSRREETSTTVDDLKKIRGEYEKIFNYSLITPFKYNYLDDPWAGDIISRLFWLNYFSFLRPHELKNYVGSIRPKLLFIGDQKNEKLKHKGVFESISGNFLISAIKNLNLLNISGITNSMWDPDYLCRIDPGFITALRPNKIIALGQNAASGLDSMQIKHVQIDHPQYAKRFYGKNALKRYSTKIMEAVYA